MEINRIVAMTIIIIIMCRTRIGTCCGIGHQFNIQVRLCTVYTYIGHCMRQTAVNHKSTLIYNIWQKGLRESSVQHVYVTFAFSKRRKDYNIGS